MKTRNIALDAKDAHALLAAIQYVSYRWTDKPTEARTKTLRVLNDVAIRLKYLFPTK